MHICLLEALQLDDPKRSRGVIHITVVTLEFPWWYCNPLQEKFPACICCIFSFNYMQSQFGRKGTVKFIHAKLNQSGRTWLLLSLLFLGTIRGNFVWNKLPTKRCHKIQPGKIGGIYSVLTNTEILLILSTKFKITQIFIPKVTPSTAITVCGSPLYLCEGT